MDYLEVIVNNRRMVIRNTILAIIFSTAVSLLMKNIYSSTALILPPQQDAGFMGMMMGSLGSGLTSSGGGFADLLGKGTAADLYVSILKSDTISDIIIDKFKLMELLKEKYRTNMYKHLSDIVYISAGKKDGIITISVLNKDPRLATDIANAYIEELERITIKLNVDGARGNRGFLEKRLVKIRTDLVTAEENLKIFQSKNKSISVTEQAKASIEAVAQLRAQLAMKEVDLANFQRQFTDSSQELKSIKTVISNIRAQISSLEGKGGAFSSTIPSIGAIPELGEEYLRLMREYKTQEMLLELLTKQYEMTKLTEAKDVVTLQVLQKARVPDRKVKPKRSIIVLASAFAAGFISILYAFLGEAVKNMSPDDKERWEIIKTKCLYRNQLAK